MNPHSGGDLYKLRSPYWERGAQNIRYAQSALRLKYPGYDWSHPVLASHSNGGDISAWLASESPGFAGSLITLDHRRVPLPNGGQKILSIRASDFAADPGVLPTASERRQSGACIMTIAGAHHNDIHDDGGAELKGKIAHAVQSFLRPGPDANAPAYACDGDTTLTPSRS